MPELPEVEVVRQQLIPLVQEKIITKVWANSDSYFFQTPPRILKKNLKGQRIMELVRQGKFLFFHLENGDSLLAHLGMTGQISQIPAKQDAHIHLILYFEQEQAPLHFRDVRKFGKVRYLTAEQEKAVRSDLGIDGLVLKPTQMRSLFWGRRQCIKTLLLNQSLIAGVGNIYADEALFAAKLHPLSSPDQLTQSELELLGKKIRSILGQAVKKGGSTISDYMQPGGKKGSYQQSHRVYGHGGKPCPVCSTPIEKITVQARGTHFCPSCQPQRSL